MSSKKSDNSGKEDKSERKGKSNKGCKPGKSDKPKNQPATEIFDGNESKSNESPSKFGASKTAVASPSSSQLPHFSLPSSVKLYGEESKEGQDAKSEVSSSGQRSSQRKPDPNEKKQSKE